MSEKEREALEKISQCFEQMSAENKRYFVGVADGIAIGREDRRDKARAEQPAAAESTSD